MSSKTDLLQIQKGEAAAFRKLQQDAKLCIEELREEIAGVSDLDVKQRLMSKVANLEGTATIGLSHLLPPAPPTYPLHLAPHPQG